jgi:hypothetical protein
VLVFSSFFLFFLQVVPAGIFFFILQVVPATTLCEGVSTSTA